MDKNDRKLTPGERERLRQLIDGKAGGNLEFARQMVRLENPGHRLDESKAEAYQKRLERLLNGDPEELTAGTGNLIAPVFKLDSYLQLLQFIKLESIVADLRRRQIEAKTHQALQALVVEAKGLPSAPESQWLLNDIHSALARMESSQLFDTALEPYRQHVADKFLEISLSGFGGPGTQGEADGKAKLASVFIDLDVKAGAKKDTEEHPQRASPLESNARTPDQVPALERLADSRRLVLIGLPGAGKTTLLKFFSLCLVQSVLEPAGGWLDHLKLWPTEDTNLIPVFIELRQFAASLPATLPPVGDGQHLTNYIIGQLKPALLDHCASALLTALAAGRVILFLDGLDEVPDDDNLRRFVLKTVEAFAGTPGKASRMVVTCRPRSYDDPRWQLAGFEQAEIAGLDNEKIEQFIERFYGEVASRNAGFAGIKADRIAKLKLAVQREELRELAANPFMLTIMAWLHRFEELPKKRATILNRLVEMLLFKWEEIRQHNSPAAIAPKLSELLKTHNLEFTSLRRVLCRLAFEARQTAPPPEDGRPAEHGVSIAKAKLQSALAELPDMEKHGQNSRERWALQVIQVIDQRTGLLVPEGMDSFTMPYKLQEFLAGEHLLNEDELGAVAEALKLDTGCMTFEHIVAQLVGDNGYWEEVVKWAAAIQAHVKGTPKQSRDLAQELCDAMALTETVRLRRAVVAGEILWEVGIQEVKNTHKRLGPDCVRQVRATLDQFWKQEILPAKQRAAAATARGWLEDLPCGVGIHETPLRRPDLVWCGAEGEYARPSNGENPWNQAFPAQTVFRLGEPKDRKDRAWNSFVQFDCTLIRKPFFISRYPVTVAQYQLFVDDGGYGKEEFWTDAGWQWREGRLDLSKWESWARDEYQKEAIPITRPVDYAPVFQTPNHPRVGVSWFEAQAFCAWLNSDKIRPHLAADLGLPTTGKWEIRLPGEAEWELAARWQQSKQRADDRRRPWGDEQTEADLTERCNWDKGEIQSTSAVGLFPKGRSDCGAEDLAGNVWEWCQTKWIDNKAINSGDLNAIQEYNSGVFDEIEGDRARVLRGGSFINDPDDLRCSGRGNVHPVSRYSIIGFRVVCSGASAR